MAIFNSQKLSTYASSDLAPVKALRAFMGLALALPMSVIPINVAQADQLPASNKLPDGFHFTVANSPYNVTSTLMIDAGSTVTIDPDVVINAPKDQALFWNLGTLKAAASTGHEIKLLGTGQPFMKVTNAPGDVNLTLDHVVLAAFKPLFDGSPNYSKTSLNMTHSDVLATQINPSRMKSLAITNNFFAYGGGIELSFTREYGSSEIATITNNTFQGDGTVMSVHGKSSGLWLEPNASWGDQISFQGNNLVGLTRPAVAATNGNVLNARGNYWGTTNSDEIQSFVLDKNDSFDWPTIVDVSGALANRNTVAPSQLSTAGQGLSPSKITVDTGNFKASVGLHKIIKATLQTVSGQPLAGFPLQVKFSGAGQQEVIENRLTDASGQVETWFGAGAVGDRTITYSSGTISTAVVASVSNPYANVSIAGRKLTITWGAANSRSIAVTDNGKRVITQLITSDEESSASVTLKPGTHKIIARLSGVVVAKTTYKIK